MLIDNLNFISLGLFWYNITTVNVTSFQVSNSDCKKYIVNAVCQILFKSILVKNTRHSYKCGFNCSHSTSFIYCIVWSLTVVTTKLFANTKQTQEHNE